MQWEKSHILGKMRNKIYCGENVCASMKKKQTTENNNYVTSVKKSYKNVENSSLKNVKNKQKEDLK